VHELSIAQGIVDICREHAGGRRVLAVTLEVGSLAGVVPESLEFCFEAATAGTVLEGARLDIVRIAATGHCRPCDQTVDIHSYFDPCPACGAVPLEVRSGEELRVRDLEVE
jgi:hydrogenase nickel incorporation protein HypA/HybF